MSIERWAARHDAIVTKAVAEEHGLTEEQLRHRVDTGRYVRVRPNVYAINGAPVTWRQQVRAVIETCGGRVSGSHTTALRVLGGEAPIDDDIHVLGPLAAQVRLPGVIGHRSGLLAREDVCTRFDMSITSPLRTVIDLSGMFDVNLLGRATDQLMRHRRLDLEELRGRVSLLRPAPGRSIKKLKIVLAQRIPGYDPGESELEARLRQIIDANGLPQPTHQHRVSYGDARYRMDFAWPDRRLYLEGNGFGYHRLATDLDGDARRQNEMVLDGWRPIELTWRMTDAEIAHTLRRFLG
jgi:very-short-patch-repair endonuclease